MRTRNALSAIIALAVMILLAGVVGSMAASDPTPTPPPRIAFVAHAFNPADALAAGPIAGQLGAPLFTTAPDSLSPATAAGLARYEPELVLVAGGSAAIADAVLEQIREATGLTGDAVDRVFGADRTATAAALARVFEDRGIDPAFLPVEARAIEATHALTAGDSALLAGQNPSSFASSGHDHFGQTWTGSGPVGLALIGDVPDTLSDDPDAVLSVINTHDNQPANSYRQVAIYAEVQESSLYPSLEPVNSAAVYGRGTGTGSYAGWGVYGRSGDTEGLWTPVGNVGVVGRGQSRGMYGSGGSSYGLYGTSLNWYGIYGRTSRGDNNYGLYTPDNLYSNNINMGGGTMATVMHNDGETALEPGDVVVFTGVIDETRSGGGLTMRVAAATESQDTAVAGVVLSRFDPEAAALAPDDPDARAGLDPTPDGPAAPGEYVLVVVHGPAQAKVTADAGSLAPGTLVSTSGHAAHAAAANGPNSDGDAVAIQGTVLGKALEGLLRGHGRVWIYVTLN